MMDERPFRVTVEFPELGDHLTKVTRVRAHGLVEACNRGGRHAMKRSGHVSGRHPHKLVITAERLLDEGEDAL
jgi:hypothetical protein